MNEIVKKVGEPAATVWAWLQTEEVRAAAGPKGATLKKVAEIARYTGFPVTDVTDAVIKLAQHQLISRITPDGRVAA